MGEFSSFQRRLAGHDDEELLALCARGDEAALAELYDRHSHVAYGLALRVVRDPHLAEDAVQEAFLTAWRTAAAFSREKGRASAWLLTLVHRRAVDVVRREDRRRAESLPETTEGAGMGADEHVSLRDRRERVQRALRQLPDEQREALELAYYGGFTQSELADHLGVPVGTVKSRTFAALGRLRELLGDERYALASAV